MRKFKMVKILQGYRLRLTLDDAVSGTVNLSDLVGKGVFTLWRDYHAFKQVQIGSFGKLVWGSQVDLCPDSLHLKATGKRPEDVFPALRHNHAHAWD